jgi:hypothetical protein
MEESFYDKQVDKALMGLIKGGVIGGGKRLASEVGSGVKRMLAGGTEPFFRSDLGERYLAHNIISGGSMLWFVTFIANCFTGSLIGWLLPQNYRAIGGFCTAIGWVMSAIVLVAFIKFCGQNVKRLAEFRAERKPYHTKSRGKPRWSPLDEFKIRVGASVVLILFAPVTGIAFVISMGVTSSLVAEQQAAIQTAAHSLQACGVISSSRSSHRPGHDLSIFNRHNNRYSLLRGLVLVSFSSSRLNASTASLNFGGLICRRTS